MPTCRRRWPTWLTLSGSGFPIPNSVPSPIFPDPPRERVVAADGAVGLGVNGIRLPAADLIRVAGRDAPPGGDYPPKLRPPPPPNPPREMTELRDCTRVGAARAFPSNAFDPIVVRPLT